MPEIEEMVPQLTLEEKAALCSGISSWETTPINRLQIPSVMMADGPHGLRIEREEIKGMFKESPRHLFPPRGDPGLTLDLDPIAGWAGPLPECLTRASHGPRPG